MFKYVIVIVEFMYTCACYSIDSILTEFGNEVKEKWLAFLRQNNYWRNIITITEQQTHITILITNAEQINIAVKCL